MTSTVLEAVRVDDLVERWRVALRVPDYRAADFVAHFLEAGYLERVGRDRVRVTELGRLESLKLRGAGDR